MAEIAVLGSNGGREDQKEPISLQMVCRTCKFPHICYVTQEIDVGILFCPISFSDPFWGTLGFKMGVKGIKHL